LYQFATKSVDSFSNYLVHKFDKRTNERPNERTENGQVKNIILLPASLDSSGTKILKNKEQDRSKKHKQNTEENNPVQKINAKKNK